MKKNNYEKNAKELNIELINLFRERFNLNMQKITNGKIKQSCLLKKVRRNIARIKTFLTNNHRGPNDS